MKFVTEVRTYRAGQASIHGTISTAVEAMALVRSLSRGLSELPHWQRAEVALSQCVECPDDATILALGESAFRDAVATEGWLETP